MRFGGSEMLPDMESENTNSSETEVKEFRKKLRNRQSAQRARDRQKARMRWLEREVAILTVKNQALQSENVALRNLIDNGKLQNSDPPRVRDTLPIKKRGQVKVAEDRSRRLDMDEDRVCPRKRPNTDFVPGRIQGKLRIINSENDEHYTSIDRVAVISPILRNDCCDISQEDQHSYSFPYPTKGLKISTKHNQNVEQINKEPHDRKQHSFTKTVPVDDTKSETVLKRMNFAQSKKEHATTDIHSTAAVNSTVFGFQPKSGFVTPNYESLVPELYSHLYHPGLLPFGFLPSSTMPKAGISSGPEDVYEKAWEMQKTLKLLQEANAITNFAKNRQSTLTSEVISAMYPRINPTAIPVVNSSLLSTIMTPSPQSMPEKVQRREVNNPGEKNNNQLNVNLTRQKMNSFESECSSQLSNDSDLRTMSP